MSTLIRKIFRIPPETGLIWGLMEKQKGVWRQTLAFLGFSIILFVSLRSVEAVAALYISMFLHELAHYKVYAKNKIQVVLMLLFPLGAIAAPISTEEDQRSDLLPWWEIGTLLLVGPTINILLIFVGMFMVNLGVWPAFGSELIQTNIILTLFNLLPLGATDGGHFFRVVFASLKKNSDRWMAFALVAFCGVIVLTIMLPTINFGFYGALWVYFKQSTIILFALFFAIGVTGKYRADKPEHASSTQAMTGKQILIQMSWYFSLVIVTMMLISLPT